MGRETAALAAFASATQWDDVPGVVQTRAKLALVDTMGVILAGSVRPEVKAGLAGSSGVGATLLAPGFAVTDPRIAALLNAIAGRLGIRFFATRLRPSERAVGRAGL